MKILFIGDVFGKCGRKAICDWVPKFKEQGIDLVIANAENTSNGKGLKKEHYQILKAAGVDVFTMGNHTWDNREIYDLFLNHHDIIRPGNITLNIENDFAQSSIVVVKKNLKIRITNLMGQSAMLSKRFNVDSPFLYMQEFLQKCQRDFEPCDLHLVDFHAESTGEKAALFQMLNGQVDAIIGTHTHVQTNDAFVSAKNTAFITDVGLTGAHDAIIGAQVKPILDFYLGQEEKMYISSGTGKYQFCAVILEVNEINKTITKIHNVFLLESKNSNCLNELL